MKVLLYRPNDGFLCEENGTSAPTHYRTLSYSLAICAAILEGDGVDVVVLDAAAEDLDWREAGKRIEATRPDLLLIAVNNFAAHLAFQGIRLAKRHLRAPVAALLTHSMEEETLRAYPFVDAVIRREWGPASRDLARAIAGNRSLGEVPGIILRSDGKIVRTSPRPHQPLDQRPLPALHLFPMKRYDAYQIAMSEGCNHHCSFCWFHVYPPSGWSGRDPDRIVAELQMMKAYGNRPVFTIDDELTLDVDYAKTLCKTLITSRIHMMLSANTRADRGDKELFSLMSKAGFFNLQFGVESGCQEILDRNGTRKKLDQVKNTFAMLEEHHISSKVFFLIGLLHETRETVERTFRFVTEDLRHYDASFDVAIPYPETWMYRYLKKRGWIESLSTEDLSWIYFHIYGCSQLAGSPMRKPWWRVGELTFDHLWELERRYYDRVPHGGRGAQLKRLALNPDFRNTVARFAFRDPLFLAQLASRSKAMQ